MTNQTTAKCPSCGTPATQPEIQEICIRTKSNASNSFATLLETCVIPNTLKDFHNNNIGEDPCMHCEHNQITEIPGSFLETKNGETVNSWLEVHLCPNCQTIYLIDPTSPPSNHTLWL